MTAKGKFRVYLAGPMSGCNDVQMRHWRDAVKARYSSKMTFLDPDDNLLNPEASPYEFVEADLQNIMEADGLLVNMWQESIGTTIGGAHAHRHGRAIAVSDPNHLENKMLTFLADAVEETPLQAAKALLNLLRAERSWRVVKSGGRTQERFERRKIMEAVRGACRDAKRDDIVRPRLVLPRVIERLRTSDRKINKSVTATDIDNAVTGVLNALESDPSHIDAVTRVLSAWQDRGSRRAHLTGPEGIKTDRCPQLTFPFRAPSPTRRSGDRGLSALRTYHRLPQGGSSGASWQCGASRESHWARPATRGPGPSARHGWASPRRRTS